MNTQCVAFLTFSLSQSNGFVEQNLGLGITDGSGKVQDFNLYSLLIIYYDFKHKVVTLEIFHCYILWSLPVRFLALAYIINVH